MSRESSFKRTFFERARGERFVHRTMRKVKSEERNEGKEGRFARQNDKRQKSGGDLRLASNDEGRKEGKELSLSVRPSVWVTLFEAGPSFIERG